MGLVIDGETTGIEKRRESVVIWADSGDKNHPDERIEVSFEQAAEIVELLRKHIDEVK